MKALAAALIISKNLEAAKQPWVPLFEIELDESTTWRFAAYPETIEWNDYEWTAMNAAIESIQEEAGSRLTGMDVHVCNVDQVVSTLMENVNLLGKNVHIYWPERGRLDIVDGVFDVSYRINDVDVGLESAAFRLGHEDLMRLQFPWRRHVRDFCDYEFRSAECRYPEDEFDAVTRQDLKKGGDRLKLGGWEVINTANADTFDIDRSQRDALTITPTSGGPYRWYDSDRDAPFAFKTFLGNFDFYTRYTGSPTENSYGLFLVQSLDDYGDSVALVAHEANGTDILSTRNTISGITTQAPGLAYLLRYWRITRTGSVLTLYGASNPEYGWTQIAQFVRIDMAQRVRVGFAAATATTAAGVAHTWEYFKAYSGGLATCDQSLDGPNGCRVHQNTPNFGGDPAMPFGRLYV